MNDNVIWESILDNKWQCRVVRKSEYVGILTCMRKLDEGEVKKKYTMDFFSRCVDLSYGAVFGPDVADVAMWQDECTNFVDKVEGKIK